MSENDPTPWAPVPAATRKQPNRHKPYRGRYYSAYAFIVFYSRIFYCQPDYRLVHGIKVGPHILFCYKAFMLLNIFSASRPLKKQLFYFKVQFTCIFSN